MEGVVRGSYAGGGERGQGGGPQRQKRLEPAQRQLNSARREKKRVRKGGKKGGNRLATRECSSGLKILQIECSKEGRKFLGARTKAWKKNNTSIAFANRVKKGLGNE